MKRLNFILLAGLSLVAAVSCNKQFNPAEEPEVQAGVPMTLTATIGGTDTKLGFTKDGNALKSTWGAKEKITVVTLNTEHRVVTIDTFETGDESAGKTTADFKGTLSSGYTDVIRVLYPAVSEFTSNRYGSALIPGTSDRAIDNLKIMPGYPYGSEATFCVNHFTQASDGDLSHLADATLLEGVGTVSTEGVLAVTLNPMTAVLKLNLTLPDEVVSLSKRLSQIYLAVKDALDNDYNCFPFGSYSYFEGIEMPKGSNYNYLDFGSWTGGTHNPMTISNTKFTAYMPILPAGTVTFGPSGGKKLEVHITGDYTKTNTIELTNDTVIAPGKIYELDVDLR